MRITARCSILLLAVLALAGRRRRPGRRRRQALRLCTSCASETGAGRSRATAAVLTTISPNGDGYRDRAVDPVPARPRRAVRLAISQAKPDPRTVYTVVAPARRRPSPLRLDPARRDRAPRTYFAQFKLVDAQGRRRTCLGQAGREREAHMGRSSSACAGSTPPSGGRATGPGIGRSSRSRRMPRELSLQFLRAGKRAHRVRRARRRDRRASPSLDLVARRDRAHVVTVPIGHWKKRVYFARLTADDGRVGYAPVRRPSGDASASTASPSCSRRHLAGVQPLGRERRRVRRDLVRRLVAADRAARPAIPQPRRPAALPPLRPALPPLARAHGAGGRLSLRGGPSPRRPGNALARTPTTWSSFPATTSTCPTRCTTPSRRFRDRGGNLLFLSANNFFWKVASGAPACERTGLWRDLRRPEAGLLGAQYRGNDQGLRQGAVRGP